MATKQQLTSQNAILKTASVQVQALTIEGKQVTLAVFRQLQGKPLLDYANRKLSGVPWGVVNYHPDKCGAGLEHLHIVWQQGNNLFRDSIYKNQYGKDHNKFPELKKAFGVREAREILSEQRLEMRIYNTPLQNLKEKKYPAEYLKFFEYTSEDEVIFHVETYENLSNLDQLFIAV